MALAAVAIVLFSGGSGTDRRAPEQIEVVPASRAALRWVGQARPLGDGAPPWARRMYRRSLLVLRALTYPDGAAIAGARQGWAYVWPRDASAVALAFAAAGYRSEARRVARFLLRLDLRAAARFYPDGTPVPGRGPQGDAAGWVAAAAQAAGLPAPPRSRFAWRDRADYQEGEDGDYLGNAITSALRPERPSVRSLYGYARQTANARDSRGIAAAFGTRRGLVREAGDPGSGLDSAAAWAVRPFPHPVLFPLVRRTLLRLAARSGRFGIVPSEDWDGGEDPWTAPTAWAAWSLAALWQIDRRTEQRGAGAEPRRFRGTALRDRRAALRLMTELRRTATPLGLPERVDARTGAPASTTPLAWSHAFAILALRELWPADARSAVP
ncbi:MAG TPA: glycoside hydrolase family 15 protein [Solirubrobacterales bacterium]|nr:glycoside hydrolase family 15 protein [Solirubrobacterales bacterium]